MIRGGHIDEVDPVRGNLLFGEHGAEVLFAGPADDHADAFPNQILDVEPPDAAPRPCHDRERVVVVHARGIPHDDGHRDHPDARVPPRRQGGVADRGHLRLARLHRARRRGAVVEDPELDVHAVLDVQTLLHRHELRDVVHVVHRGDRDLRRALP